MNVKKTLSFNAILILNVALYVFVIEKIYDPRVFISLRDRTSKPGQGKGEKYELNLNGLRNVVKAERNLSGTRSSYHPSMTSI